MKHALLISLLMLAIFAACSDDSVQPTPAPATPVTWQRDDIQGVSEEQLVALQAGDQDLLVLGEGFFVLVDPRNDTQQWFPLSTFKDNPLPFAGRDYFVYPGPENQAQEYKSIVINWRATGAGAIPTQLDLPPTALDATLPADAFYPSVNGSTIAAINNSGQMLVPVAELKNGSFSSYLYLVQLNPVAPGNFSVIKIDVERRIDWPYASFPHVMTVNGSFYAANAWATYEVHADGTFTKLLDHWVVDMIEHDGRLFANTYDGIYSSMDNGGTWTQSTFDLGGGRLFIADGRVCVLQDQGYIRVVDLGAEPVHAARSLNTDGIPRELSVLRAAVQFGDRVYVATSSGLYSKPLDHFFTPQAAR